MLDNVTRRDNGFTLIRRNTFHLRLISDDEEVWNAFGVLWYDYEY